MACYHGAFVVHKQFFAGTLETELTNNVVQAGIYLQSRVSTCRWQETLYNFAYFFPGPTDLVQKLRELESLVAYRNNIQDHVFAYLVLC